MRPLIISAARLLVATAVLAALPAALAHGDDDHMDMSIDVAEQEPQQVSDAAGLTYFRLPEHTGAIYGHIALMLVAWIVVLPIGKCLIQVLAAI